MSEGGTAFARPVRGLPTTGSAAYSDRECLGIVNRYWGRMSAECPRDGASLRIGHQHASGSAVRIVSQCPDCERELQVLEVLGNPVRMTTMTRSGYRANPRAQSWLMPSLMA